MGAGDVGLVQGGLHLSRRPGRPHRRQGTTGDDEVTRPMGKADDRIQGLGDLDELPVADELEIAASLGRDAGAPGVQLLEQLRRASARPVSGSVIASPGNSASMARSRSRAIPAMTSGSWIDLAMWWMKYTSTARSNEQQRFGHGDGEVGDEIARRAVSVMEPSPSTE